MIKYLLNQLKENTKMTGIYLMLPTLLVIFSSFLVVRAGAIALMRTGMDKEKANFQALSAFSRAGFTTRETELVMNNSRRRRIVTWLIVIGNAGLVAVVVTATSSVTISSGYQIPISIAILIAGIYAIYRLMKLRGWTRKWDEFIEKRLIKSQVIDEPMVEDLLRIKEGYGLLRVVITPESPYVGHYLSELHDPSSQFVVIGIEREKKWISYPKSRTKIAEGDRLIVYGVLEELKEYF